VPKFHISFFKNILSSDGHPFKCLQKTVDVSSSTIDAAVANAKAELEAESRVHWDDRADSIEVQESA
jgi:hypothetical protein